MSPTLVIGLDGGLAHMGIAVADISDGPRPRIVWSGVYETVKGHETTAAADNLRRARELALLLDAAFDTHQPTAVFSESMSFPRNAATAAMLSMSLGVASAVAARHGLAIEGKTPMALKRALTGNASAKKDEMIAAVRELYPEVEWERRSDLHEHQADAVAAIHAFVGPSAGSTDWCPTPRAPSRLLKGSC